MPISIPLSILTSIIILSLMGETINTMTLGGLALAVGILVDDATVTIENIERFLEKATTLREAILDGAAQIAVPALVSTLCICIVFLPMFLLNGVARYLFVPLAEAVMFAMLASYILSRTLVPTLAMYHAAGKEHGSSAQYFCAFSASVSSADLSPYAALYQLLLTRLVFSSQGVCAELSAGLPVRLSALAISWAGLLSQHGRGRVYSSRPGKTGMRIEETARLATWSKTRSARRFPGKDLNNILDNIGLPYSPMNTMHSTSGIVGAADGDVMVTLNEDHHPTAELCSRAARELAARVSRERCSTFCLPTSRRKFSTSVCRRPSIYS